MLQSDQAWLSVTDAFYSAAIDGAGWSAAIEGLAAATGSWAGQLVGFGSANTMPFNWVAGVGDDWVHAFLSCGGTDPNINPYVRVGTAIPVLKVVSTAEIVTRQEHRTNAFFTDFAWKLDTPYICLTPLVIEKSDLVGMAVLRSGKQGEIGDAERAVFASVAPHVRAAVRMQMALEHQGAQVMAGALEALSLAVFVCDRQGAVKAMTRGAEALVTGASTLRLSRGRLGTPHPAETRALSDAISVAAAGQLRPGAPPASTVLVRGTPLVLEVVPLPRREYAFGFEPRALVVVRGGRSDPEHTKRLLQLVYGLTATEAEIALCLAAGRSPEAIASERGTSVGTVRTQVRTIYTKLDVRRQSEMIARVNQLR